MNVELQSCLIPILALAASYCTSIACRLAVRRHRASHWSFALIGVAAAVALVVGFIWLGFSLQPGDLPYAGLILRSFGIVIAGGGLMALLPAEAVVWYYRHRFGEHDHAD